MRVKPGRPKERLGRLTRAGVILHKYKWELTVQTWYS